MGGINRWWFSMENYVETSHFGYKKWRLRSAGSDNGTTHSSPVTSCQLVPVDTHRITSIAVASRNLDQPYSCWWPVFLSRYSYLSFTSPSDSIQGTFARSWICAVEVMGSSSTQEK